MITYDKGGKQSDYLYRFFAEIYDMQRRQRATPRAVDVGLKMHDITPDELDMCVWIVADCLLTAGGEGLENVDDWVEKEG